MQSTINDTLRKPSYVTIDNEGNPLSFLDTSSGKGRGFWQRFANFGITMTGGRDTSITVIASPLGIGSISDTVYETYDGVVITTVPAGTYYTKYFQDSSGSSFGLGTFQSSSVTTQKIYFTAGVGMVKTSTYSSFSYPGISKKFGSYGELVSYHVQ